MQDKNEDLPAVALLFCKRNDIVQPYTVMRKTSLMIGRNNPLHDEIVDIDMGPFTRFVSRKHFRIRHVNENSFIGDVVGKNGIFVDGDFFRSGISVILPLKCFLRFPSTDMCISFISLLQPENSTLDEHHQVDVSSVVAGAGLLDNPSDSSNLLKQQLRLCTTRSSSPTGTISAFNSCPPSPHRSGGNLGNSPVCAVSNAAAMKKSCILLYSGGASVHENNYQTINTEEPPLNSDVLTSADDTVVLDDDIVWNVANDRDHAAMGLLSAEEVRAELQDDVAITSTVDFHDTDAQMPPLPTDDADDFASSIGDCLVSAANVSGALHDDAEIIEGEPPNLDSELPPKPALSYVQLIAQSLLSSESRQLPLKAIYSFISEHYPHYRPGDHVWQNSIRHTLCTSPYFVKIDGRQVGAKKGNFWGFSDDYDYDSLIDNAYDKNYRRQRPKRTRQLPPSPIKQKLIAPAPLPISSIMPVTLVSTEQGAMPSMQPLTILLSPQSSTNQLSYTMVPQSLQAPQQQMIYLQVEAAASVVEPECEIQNQFSSFNNAGTSSFMSMSSSTANRYSSEASCLDIATSDFIHDIRTTAFSCSSRQSAQGQPVMIGRKRVFVTPVDVSSCSSSSSFSAYFPKR